MPYVQVDVDLDDFDLDDLLDEIKDRYFRNGIRGKSNKTTIDKFLKELKIEPEDVLETSGLSLLNKMKVDLVMNNIDKITLNDLEKLI